MKITVVLATRDELPQNMNRTLDGLKSHGMDVDIRYDSPSLGCGIRRHEGVIASKTEGVFLCDGHMDFSEGYFETLSAELDKTPDALLVTRMQSIGHDWTPMSGTYFGAEITTFDKWENNQHIPICAKWRRSDTGDGPVGAVMGACYAFTKSAYMEWGEPLSILRAWGGDEEALSIAAWMKGSGCRLVPGTARHMYAAPKSRAPGISDDEAARVWANRLALINAIPMAECERQKLRDWLYMTPWLSRLHRQIVACMSETEPCVTRLRTALQKGVLTWDQYIKQWGMKKQTEVKMGRPRKQTTTVTTEGRKEPRANYGANENRRVCHKCGSTASAVNSIRHCGRMTIRYRVCSDCGQKRTTQDIAPIK
jgi:hypothetical protein